MSEDTAEVRESGEAMLWEVKRVLKPTGRSVGVGGKTMYKCTAAAAVAVARTAFPAPQLVLNLSICVSLTSRIQHGECRLKRWLDTYRFFLGGAIPRCVYFACGRRSVQRRYCSFDSVDL